MQKLTPQLMKERERNVWASVAGGWQRRDALLRKGAMPVAERMLELARIRRGHRVLDIASGTGEPAITAAHIVGDTGRVIGTDLVEDMLAFAREKAAAASLDNIEFLCVDGEELGFPPSSFDAVTIRWGLMFMPEPGECLKRAHHMLEEGGCVVVACWAEPERNPFVSLVMKVLAQYMDIPKPPPDAPGIFAFADPDRLTGVMKSAGFDDVRIEDMEIDVIEVDSGAAYWEAISDLAGPVMVLVNQLDEKTRGRFVSHVIDAANEFMTGDSLRMRGTTWIASGTRQSRRK